MTGIQLCHDGNKLNFKTYENKQTKRFKITQYIYIYIYIYIYLRYFYQRNSTSVSIRGFIQNPFKKSCHPKPLYNVYKHYICSIYTLYIRSLRSFFDVVWRVDYKYSAACALLPVHKAPESLLKLVS